MFEPPLFAIADGMGGARAGEVAAGIAAAALRDGRQRRRRRGEPRGDHRGGQPARVGALGRRSEHRRDGYDDHRRVSSTLPPRRSCSGTSATPAPIACAAGSSSRSRPTTPSSQSSCVRGVLTPEEAERHPQRSAITRAVGTERAIEADVFTVPAEPGDLILICSDGLTDMLSEAEIAAVIVGAERTRPGRRRRSSRRRTNTAARTTSPSCSSSSWRVTPSSEPAAPEPGAGPESRSFDRWQHTSRSRRCRTHGAGPGGRAAAIGFIALVVVVGLLALYWGISR